ncbi:uncharacterized protein [Solanum lycopersicum]|uniref:uncharacterized protein n=1 Tax=Solanum lycopersicum TaxID=4081 RepID=UPI003749F883
MAKEKVKCYCHYSNRSKDQLGIDYHHPLFLHASDAPSSMSIGTPLVGMENYSIWCEAMQLSLLTRNKLGFVDRSINRGTFGPAYELLWDRCNAIGTLSVSTYYSKLKDLWDEYDSLRPPPCCDYTKSKDYATHIQYQRLLQFLMGLNDGYANARSQILMKSHVPNVNQAYAMVLQDETQKNYSR